MITDDKLTEKRRAFDARGEQLLAQGYDKEAAAAFVACCAGGLTGHALDIGTGRGIFAIALARAGMTVTTVDPDEQDSDLAAMLVTEAGVADRVHFMRGDAAGLPLQSASFDCVAMMDVLHHIADPAPVFDEMIRLVRPGGILLIADFDEDGFDMLSRIHHAAGGDHTRTEATVETARATLAARGLACLKQVHAHKHHVIVMS